jgi:Holliday junction resolvase RusA-like endonuclease
MSPLTPEQVTEQVNTACYFEVPGPFGVKGSTYSFRDPRSGTIRTKTDAKHGKTFAAAVRWAATQAGVTRIPKGRGVSVSVIYGFARPKGRDRARCDPCVRPDADKLGRALLDALTGIAYDDDGQVVALSVRKIYADQVRARVVVMAEPLEPDPPIVLREARP